MRDDEKAITHDLRMRDGVIVLDDAIQFQGHLR
jgi:hypothetical protein